MKALERVGAFSGAAWVLLANLSSAMVGEGSGGGGSPGQRTLDEAERIAENPWTRPAYFLVILGTMALIMFVGYLCWRVREGGWVATTAMVAGTAAIIANLISTSIVITISVLRDELSPELAHALEDLDGAGHLVQSLPLGVFVLFASVGALMTRALGRVLGWAGVAVGATSIIVFAASGLPDTDDIFAWPFLLVLLWVAVVSLRLGFVRTRNTAPTPAEHPST
ncbi:hypothetical protein [Cryobacterium sp.]|uniref:hypothetical protein n=1 Tax=Cryobacterium sp. TaxID=1926290 RepID=UPI00260C24F5|nr:hypothetical protein [Cryobacterium sp.]MCU1446711.1 hypothetical protein [Cryobacterium sp.]